MLLSFPGGFSGPCSVVWSLFLGTAGGGLSQFIPPEAVSALHLPSRSSPTLGIALSLLQLGQPSSPSLPPRGASSPFSILRAFCCVPSVSVCPLGCREQRAGLRKGQGCVPGVPSCIPLPTMGTVPGQRWLWGLAPPPGSPWHPQGGPASHSRVHPVRNVFICAV